MGTSRKKRVHTGPATRKTENLGFNRTKFAEKATPHHESPGLAAQSTQPRSDPLPQTRDDQSNDEFGSWYEGSQPSRDGALGRLEETGAERQAQRQRHGSDNHSEEKMSDRGYRRATGQGGEVATRSGWYAHHLACGFYRAASLLLIR